MDVKRFLVLVTAVLLCAAGAGVASAAIVPAVHHLSVAGRTTPTPRAAPMMTVSNPVPSPVDPLVTAAAVQQAMQAVLPNAQVGFEVFDRQTGTVLTSHNTDQQFPAMSVVKLLIALDTLASDNWMAPDEETRQEIHQMLADSDDQIADRLWTAHGGPAIVTRMVSLLGLTGTWPPDDPSEWGDTKITPQDMVTVYRYITDQLPNPNPTSNRDFVLGALADAPQIAADGFDQYFGIPRGMPHSTWAIKQGWGTSGSQAVMNSTGLVGTDLRYVVVVLAAASADSYSTVPAVVTAGVRVLAGLLGTTAS